ncbi:MAG: VWA domain-containing protein [Anaerolineae bacterium]|nr:VWA domain-containing protein [Anaerolineae bacterium]
MKARSIAIAIAISTLLIGGCACGVAARPPTSQPAQQEPLVERVVTREVEKEVVVTRIVQGEARPRPTATPLPMATASPGNVPVVPVYGGEELPNDEPYDSMFFEHYGVNPFIDVEDDPLSTFAMDVDTASYTIARRYIKEGHLPPQDAVRVEEFVNYFDPTYRGPEEGTRAFAIHVEGAPAPFGETEAYHLIRIGIQGRRIHDEDRKDATLTFVVDVSGSMERENRLELVKRALRLLVDELRPSDSVGIVAYGDTARVILQPTYASERGEVLRAIDRLRTGGSTYAEAGLREGYRMANRSFREGTINRVILCSDGVANVGETGADAILDVIGEYAGREIALSTVGFGLGNYNDVLMEQLADKGNGNYAYVDTESEARRIFVEELTGTLQVIARDAKIQVEFNPAVVSRYRLLGYENRAVADQDFRNDAVDAGEVGVGHHVTALYEVKFQRDPDGEEAMGYVLTVRVRYQDPDSGYVHEVQRDAWRDDLHPTFDQASPSFRLTAAVAEYAEILRGSYWAQDGSLSDVRDIAARARRDLEWEPSLDAEVAEWIALVERAEELSH